MVGAGAKEEVNGPGDGEEAAPRHDHGAGDQADDAQGVAGGERRAVDEDRGAELGGEDVGQLLAGLGVVPAGVAAVEVGRGDVVAGEQGVGGGEQIAAVAKHFHLHALLAQELRQVLGVLAVVVDQGDGFDWKPFMEFSAERAFDPHGRGISLARMLSFDATEYQGNGNTVLAVVKLS